MSHLNVKPVDGFKCFLTYEVRCDRCFIGAIQAVYAYPSTFGGRADYYKGPWIAFVGDDMESCVNLAGQHASIDKALAAICEATDDPLQAK